MASNCTVRRVDSAQRYIKDKYSDTVGLANSILGQVLLGTIKGTKRKKEVIKFCLKDMQSQFSDRVAEDPRMEIEFMNEICNRSHPNFVRFLDAVEDRKLYCICLEYVSGGDMCTYLQNLRTGIDNDRAQRYVVQLTKAVYFMHHHGYCHLDLSLENVLWDKRNDVLKICDFGLARKFPNGDMDQYFASASVRPGKKGYMAPEIYAYQRFNGMKADVFSLGVLIFILLTGFPPFNTPNSSDKCFQYMYYGKLEWLLKQWKLNDVINEQCRDLLSKIFCHGKKRISIKEMLEHEWLGQNIEDVELEMASYTLKAVSSSSGSDNESNHSAGDTKEESPSVNKMEAAPPPTTATGTAGAAVTKTRESNQHKTSIEVQEASPAPSTPTTPSVSNMNPTTATKKRKSTTIVKKKRLSKTMKSKKGKKSIHSTKGSGGSGLSVSAKEHGKDEGITLSLSASSDKSTSRCNVGTTVMRRRALSVSIHESSTLLSQFGATVSPPETTGVSSSSYSNAYVNVGLPSSTQFHSDPHPHGPRSSSSKTRSKSLASINSSSSFMRSFAKDVLSHSMHKPHDAQIRRGSESSIREESPPSTMSHSSQHSETAHTAPREMKKKKEKEEYEYKRNLPKHRKNAASAAATANIGRENANLRGSARHGSPPENNTQLITERFAKISCHGGDSNNSDGFPDENEFDNDRKEDPAAAMTRSQSMEGNETYDPYVYADTERRDSVASQEHEERRMSDAGSVHSESQHSNGPVDEAHHALNGSTSDKHQATFSKTPI